MMNNFIDKWNTNNIFKTKIKLGLYTAFVVIVAIFAFSSRDYGNTNSIIDEYSEGDKIFGTDTLSLEIPEIYNYTVSISINEENYKYTGFNDVNYKTITKTINGTSTNYIYTNNIYYKDSISQDNMVEKEEIYDIIEYNYINLENINQYLSVSKKEEEKNIVYIKDIILGNDSEDYITIELNENKINIDYTSLMKLFDKTIESCVVEVIIKEVE